MDEEMGRFVTVDTHVHVVATDQERYPLQPSSAQTGAKSNTVASWFNQMPITAEQLLERMEAAEVDRAVLVQPVSAYHYDNSYAADSALRHPKRFISIGVIDMLTGGAANCLEYLVQERGMRGLRITAVVEGAETQLDDPRTYPVWERAASLRLPVCVHIDPQHIPMLRNLLKRFPTVTVAVDHLAHSVGYGQPNELAEELFSLAESPNVYVKFSTPNLGVRGTGTTVSHEYIQQVVECFGARRVMWGSNFPATYDRSYREMIDASYQVLSFLQPEDQRWIFGETALSIWPGLRG
jgi:predicted TIM-barrel fold metal-dependent hydrolase